jgi:hypothetical protein
MSDASKIIDTLNTVYTGKDWSKIYKTIYDMYYTLIISKKIIPFVPDSTGRETIRMIQTVLPSYTQDDITSVLQTINTLVNTGEINGTNINPLAKIEEKAVKKDKEPSLIDTITKFFKEGKSYLLYGTLILGFYFGSKALSTFKKGNN